MNYRKHYNSLIVRARDREEEGLLTEDYYEKHHVLPRCLGGSDKTSNLVKLTPEEHYVAHQLLVKMHPEHSGLVFAALRMTHHSSGRRINNKAYGWLRKKYSNVMKGKTGNRNSSYGRSWYHDPATFISGKFLKEDIPEGWVRGRVVDIDKKKESEIMKQLKKDKLKKREEIKIKNIRQLYDLYLSMGISLKKFSLIIGRDDGGLNAKFKKYVPEFRNRP